MTRVVFLLAVAASLSACGDCSLSEATGAFEIFKDRGCYTLDDTVDPTAGALISINHPDAPTATSARELTLGLVGPLYTGRRGTCQLTFELGGEPAQVGGAGGSHCDYQVQGSSRLSDRETRYSIEVLDATGPTGTFRGVVSVNSQKKSTP